MSDSAFQDWLVSDSWQDYRQQRAIREIESSLDGQRAESRALRSQLSRLQGSLEQRLSRLIRSFDAFVELSDRRAELAGFDEAARVRYRMRQVLAFRAGAAPALPATLEDVDGYWLAPAAAAVAAITRGDDPAAELARAAERDHRRTALLLVMSGADVDVRWVSAAFSELLADTQVTVAERALWVAAADGHLGDAALEVVTARLRALVAGLGDERRADLDRWITERVHAQPVTRLTSSADRRAVVALTAASRLAALRDWAREPASPAADSQSLAALEALLPGLVDEGSDEEAATLHRIKELRAVIDDREIAPAARWSDPVELPLTLLVADAFGEAPGPRVLARRVLRDRVLAVGEALRAETDVPDPQEQSVAVEGQTVRVRTNGAAPADLDALHRAIEARYPLGPSKVWQRYAWFGAAALLLLGALAVPLGFAVIMIIAAVVLAFVGVRRIFADRMEANGRNVSISAARERADKTVEQERKSLVELCRRLDEARRQAPEDLAALRTAL
ncbi:hypothetical protein Dvina_01975 [Dactylosporangium vinaceum]|uniref:Uncharacterized protein n=1 Tax=Dactylosporangium vinaceum TaxID=53362 RepID=A0ABV5MF59_9ACTN|nr:hypothetical protein [Dactylosporangium vinaceum]UAB97004.1 hypothetical protein Dvina_01975 [Dactylosporangium vinaceum]